MSFSRNLYQLTDLDPSNHIDSHNIFSSYLKVVSNSITCFSIFFSNSLFKSCSILVKGCEPFSEDLWKGLKINTFKFQGVKLCSRCKVRNNHPWKFRTCLQRQVRLSFENYELVWFMFLKTLRTPKMCSLETLVCYLNLVFFFLFFRKKKQTRNQTCFPCF